MKFRLKNLNKIYWVVFEFNYFPRAPGKLVYCGKGMP